MKEKFLIDAAYFVVAILFILGLKSMSSPVTARRGIIWAGIGMVVATAVTFLWPGMGNFALMIIAMVIGGGVAWWGGKVVKMTDMPQMVAIYNGMGGGAAAAIAAVEFARGEIHSPVVAALATLGALIGSIAFSGSCVAFAKLQGIMKKTFRLPLQNGVNVILAGAAILIGVSMVVSGHPTPAQVVTFFIVSLVLGAIIPSDAGAGGHLLHRVAGAGCDHHHAHRRRRHAGGDFAAERHDRSGGRLRRLRAGQSGADHRRHRGRRRRHAADPVDEGGAQIAGSMKEASANDVASMMLYAQKVFIVPGYGMAVAQAQHKVWEMAELLETAGVEVKFAIHPVAGRMPGHMNVLLAEAGVPYDKIFDLEEINAEFDQADVALVIGANDVVNPVARTDKSSPIYGMPILNADHAHNVICIKRGKGAGYSGIENALFYGENTRMLYGSAQQAISQVIQNIKSMAE
ncbi:MAG: pntB [Proteobacteria bacterium]|nr:pntB [Pseudomonadota bacterium]